MDTSRWANMSPWRRTAMDPLTSPLLGSSPGRRGEGRREEVLRHDDVARDVKQKRQTAEAKRQHQKQKKKMPKQQRQQHEEGNQLLKEQHDQQQQLQEENLLQEQQQQKKKNQGQGQQGQQQHKQEQARQQKHEFVEHQLKNPAATAVGTQTEVATAASAVTPSKAGAAEADASPRLSRSAPEPSEVGNTIKELQKLVQDMEERLGDEEFQVRLVAEPKEKLGVGETIMSGLLKLDKLQFFNEHGREQRRVLAGQLNALLYKVEALRTRGDIGSEE